MRLYKHRQMSAETYKRLARAFLASPWFWGFAFWLVAVPALLYALRFFFWLRLPFDYPDDLRLQMNSRELLAIADAPDGIVEIGGCSVWYYSRGIIGDRHISTDYPREIKSPKELPWVYGNYQLLFDAEGSLQAYTCNGEEIHIHTSSGNFQGSDLEDLSQDFWVEICEIQIPVPEE